YTIFFSMCFLFAYFRLFFIFVTLVFFLSLHHSNRDLHSFPTRRSSDLIHVNEKLIKLSFWLYFFSLFPAVFLSLLWYEVGTVGYIGAWIGAVGQFISIIILFIALLQHVKPFIASVSQHMAISYLFVFIMLFGKHLMEFGLLYLPFAEVIYDTRSVVVGYLHLLLLGFISMFIFNLYQSTELLSEAKKRVTFGIAIFL